MSEIFSFCFEQLTDPLSLPLSPLAEWVILTILHQLVYTQAFSMVGNLYHSGYISGRFIGSFLHWFFRAISFLVAWCGIKALIFTYRFVTEHWLMIIGAIASILFTMVIYKIVAKHWSIKTDH